MYISVWDGNKWRVVDARSFVNNGDTVTIRTMRGDVITVKRDDMRDPVYDAHTPQQDATKRS